MWNKDWKKGIDYPEWGDTEVYKKTIGGGYLYNGETPKEAYRRVARTVAKRLQKTEMEETFFHVYVERLALFGVASVIKYWNRSWSSYQLLWY